MNANQEKAQKIREQICEYQSMIEDLEGKLMDIEDYQCVIPKAYNTLTEFLKNHKENEQYAICDNYEDANEILSDKEHRTSKHIVLLSDKEISEVKQYFPIRNLNSDWKRNHPNKYNGVSKLHVGLGIYQ